MAGCCGGGAAITPDGPRLRASVELVFRQPRYRVKARYWMGKIARADGLARAANIVEQAIARRQRVTRV